jgi:hypothetical protein
MRDNFADYVAQNPEIHFSAGIVTEKPGAPVGALAELAEEALKASKQWPDKVRSENNAVTCFRETVAWSEWPELERALSTLDALIDDADLSAGYVYRLLQFIDMRREEQKGTAAAAIWRAWLKYATRRFVVDKRGLWRLGRLRSQKRRGRARKGYLQRSADRRPQRLVGPGGRASARAVMPSVVRRAAAGTTRSPAFTASGKQWPNGCCG